MCGIALVAQRYGARDEALHHSLKKTVQARGHVDCALSDVDVVLMAAVLGLRGAHVQPQPLITDTMAFAWNGEVFDTPDAELAAAAERGNDGAAVWERLCAAAAHEPLEEALVRVLGIVEGPYAFVLVHRATGHVYYGRDPLGRRSLLLATDDRACCLTSTASNYTVLQRGLSFVDVPCATLWALDLCGAWAPRSIARRSPLAERLIVSSGMDAVPYALDTLEHALRESVRRRVQRIRSVSAQSSSSPHTAVLFSGGLDCTVLAALAAAYAPAEQPIDLINVAFENPRAIAAARAQGPSLQGEFPDDPYAVPDRVTARASAAELAALWPARTWHLVEVNVPYSEYVAHLEVVRTLLYPSDSVMDLSIAAALYFAARAQGQVGGAPYVSPARVLLSGLGADELLGGYARHRQAWRRGGADALTAELQLDLDRLPTRNLGRDDRVISAHARETRYPYLARDVVQVLAGMPVHAKADLSQPEGAGDKLLLRRFAHRLGVSHAARLPKRAIQFGARSAKMDPEAARVKGDARLSPQRR